MGKVGRPIKRTAEAVVKDIKRQTSRLLMKLVVIGLRFQG